MQYKISLAIYRTRRLKYLFYCCKNHYIEIPDDLIVSFECSECKQKLAYVLDCHKFQFLFDIALHNIAHGDYRSAILNFQNALEEFYKFFILVLLSTNTNIFKNEFSKRFKLSERLLGAFIVLYKQHFKNWPETLSENKQVPLRNKVVHSGYIPTYKETISFGEETGKLIL